MRHSLFAALSLSALAALTPAHAGAQSDLPLSTPRAEGRVSLDYFLSRNRLAREAGHTELDGIGGRVMWPLAALHGRGSTLLDRLSLGGYVVHTPEDGDDTQMLHYGAQADFRVAGSPLAGRVDPLLSLGVGAVRVEEPEPAHPYVMAPEALHAAPEVRTSPSLVPGIGARIHLLPALGFRTDLRVVIDFRERTTRSLELSGGISLPI